MGTWKTSSKFPEHKESLYTKLQQHHSWQRPQGVAAAHCWCIHHCTVTAAHWDFLCSDHSNLNLMRWWILIIVSCLGIHSDKIIILGTKIIKLTWEIILMKMKMSARWRHCSKIFKTNLKSHISSLLNRPQGCQGCQKNQNKFWRFLCNLFNFGWILVVKQT